MLKLDALARITKYTSINENSISSYKFHDQKGLLYACFIVATWDKKNF